MKKSPILDPDEMTEWLWPYIEKQPEEQREFKTKEELREHQKIVEKGFNKAR